MKDTYLISETNAVQRKCKWDSSESSPCQVHTRFHKEFLFSGFFYLSFSLRDILVSAASLWIYVKFRHSCLHKSQEKNTSLKKKYSLLVHIHNFHINVECEMLKKKVNKPLRLIMRSYHPDYCIKNKNKTKWENQKNTTWMC